MRYVEPGGPGTESGGSYVEPGGPYARLARYEDAFPGHRAEIVEGSLVLCPLRPHDNTTVWMLWAALDTQLPGEWGFISDVVVPFDDDNEFCPDLAVIPAAAADRNLSAYSPELIELVIEVVSPSSIRNDYEVKNRAYARRGIRDYLVFDPYQGHCVALRYPGPDGYLGRDTFPYGDTVPVDTRFGKLHIDTVPLPVAPKA
ncbi:Uma2 family endonuclease [Streptomyces sp. NPDC046203]|uniref:Uma2 family endonuclease n=1 Tax=Streptomyces sp. NPDC046203 TaxID=3154602 RepID=UPI0033EC00AC